MKFEELHKKRIIFISHDPEGNEQTRHTFYHGALYNPPYNYTIVFDPRLVIKAVSDRVRGDNIDINGVLAHQLISKASELLNNTNCDTATVLIDHTGTVTEINVDNIPSTKLGSNLTDEQKLRASIAR